MVLHDDMSEFQVQLAELRERFGDAPIITLKQAADYLHRDPRSLLAYKDFPVKTRRNAKRMSHDIPVVALAKWLSK